jgi:hypothetical protein
MSRDKWVPVTKAWRFLRLRMKDRPPIWKVAVIISNNESRIANKGWFSSLEVERYAENSLPYKLAWLRNKVVGDMGEWAGSIWFRIGTGSICECGNEPSGFITCGKFLD